MVHDRVSPHDLTHDRVPGRVKPAVFIFCLVEPFDDVFMHDLLRNFTPKVTVGQTINHEVLET